MKRIHELQSIHFIKTAVNTVNAFEHKALRRILGLVIEDGHLRIINNHKL